MVWRLLKRLVRFSRKSCGPSIGKGPILGDRGTVFESRGPGCVMGREDVLPRYNLGFIEPQKKTMDPLLPLGSSFFGGRSLPPLFKGR